MQNGKLEPYEVWNGLKMARLPLCLLVDLSNIQSRMKVNKWTASETAFVHRMFDLLYTLRDPILKSELTKEETDDADDFWTQYESLPWVPLPSHPHISELGSTEELLPLQDPARKLDERLERRTSMTLAAMFYRFRKGWPLFEPKRKQIESLDTTSCTPR